MALTVLRTISQVLCRVSLKSEFSWGGSPERRRAIFVMSYQGCTPLTCLRTAEADLDHLVGWYGSGFSTGKLLSPSFPHCTLGKQTMRHNPPYVLVLMTCRICQRYADRRSGSRCSRRSGRRSRRKARRIRLNQYYSRKD